MIGAILIIARNNVHLTKAAVRTALDQTVPCDVMVIDNASTDGTAAWIRSKEHARLHSWCYLVQRSLAECWNLGLKTLWQNGHNVALVINNDVQLRQDTYSMLSGLVVNSLFCGIVSAVSVDSVERMGVVGDRLSEPLWDNRRPHPDFSCFAIHKDCTDMVGFFDQSYYPAYCEDSDYHVRMHKAGITAFCVDLPFYHAAAQTVKQADPGERERIIRGADENRERFRLKYGCLPGTPEYEALFT